jgi:hypothetical protein
MISSTIDTFGISIFSFSLAFSSTMTFCAFDTAKFEATVLRSVTPFLAVVALRYTTVALLEFLPSHYDAVNHLMIVIKDVNIHFRRPEMNNIQRIFLISDQQRNF